MMDHLGANWITLFVLIAIAIGGYVFIRPRFRSSTNENQDELAKQLTQAIDAIRPSIKQFPSK